VGFRVSADVYLDVVSLSVVLDLC